MQPAPLSQPIGAIMRPTHSVHREDSLSAAAQAMRENGTSLIPVLENERFAGIVSEASLATAIAAGAEPNDQLTAALQPGATCRSHETGAEGLRQFEQTGADALVVVDDVGHVSGLLLPSDLIYRRSVPIRPPLIGGMATPFGVYLTTGSAYGGVRQLLLVTTGMAMFSMLVLANVIGLFSLDFAVNHGLSEKAANEIAGPFILVLFALQMRLAPLSGIHAAEHKVVHAIERGEELTPEIVRRMPRVHPRCGTNIAVGLSIFIGVVSAFPDKVPLEYKVLPALLITAAFWRPLGSLAQYWVTTRPPSNKHIQMGIRAGKELLERYQVARVARPNIFMRLLNSGLFHVVAGSLIAYGLLYLVALVFHLDWLLQGIV